MIAVNTKCPTTDARPPRPLARLRRNRPPPECLRRFSICNNDTGCWRSAEYTTLPQTLDKWRYLFVRPRRNRRPLQCRPSFPTENSDTDYWSFARSSGVKCLIKAAIGIEPNQIAAAETVNAAKRTIPTRAVPLKLIKLPPNRILPSA